MSESVLRDYANALDPSSLLRSMLELLRKCRLPAQCITLLKVSQIEVLRSSVYSCYLLSCEYDTVREVRCHKLSIE